MGERRQRCTIMRRVFESEMCARKKEEDRNGTCVCLKFEREMSERCDACVHMCVRGLRDVCVCVCVKNREERGGSCACEVLRT